MTIYSHDRIYFSWIPRKTDFDGWVWLAYIRDVVASSDGKKYEVLRRDSYRRC